MVFALSEDRGGARRCPRSPDSLLSAALGKGIRAMAGEHSRLVYQPADLVGTSDSSLVSEAEVRGRDSEIGNLRRTRAAAGSRQLDPGGRHTRHLVLIVALGLRDNG